MDLFLGIDGGGSRTRAVLCDHTGRVVGRGDAGLSNFQEAGSETALANLDQALTLCLGGSPRHSISAAFFGMAGVVSEADHAEVKRLARLLAFSPDCRVGVDHDIRIALTGGLAGAPGIALIAGTGSACYGRNGTGRTAQCGGWGSLADDVGSGGWIGRHALEHAVRQADGREPQTALKARVFAFLGLADEREFMQRVHRVGLPREEMATLARDILNLEQEGDPAAKAIVQEAIDGLTELVKVTKDRLEMLAADVVLAGGLTEDHSFSARLEASIEAEVPGAQTVAARFPPVVGACLEALSLHEIVITESLADNLERSLTQSQRQHE